MAAGYKANTCTWLVASGPSQIELVVIDWLRRWIGYPDSAGAIDPLEAMADYCEAEGIWLHVDGAYGGFAAVTERGKRLLAGIERADSVGMDAHKWFFQPYEAGCLLVKDVGADLRDGRVPAGRVAGHGAGSPRGGTHPEEPPAGAAEPRVTGDRVLSDQSRRCRFRRAGPGRYQPDRARPRLLEDRAFMSSTRLRKMFSLRLCIVNHTTTWDDICETLETVERFGGEALAGSSDS